MMMVIFAGAIKDKQVHGKTFPKITSLACLPSPFSRLSETHLIGLKNTQSVLPGAPGEGKAKLLTKMDQK